MAKAPKVLPAEGEEVQLSNQSEPEIIQQARKHYGENPDYWPIWLKNEYNAWLAGGPAPSGSLDEVLGKKKEKAE
jgi:hypothetical protein